MNEAMSEYMGTAEEMRITVANADLALAKVEQGQTIHKTALTKETRTNCPNAATFWDIYSISPPIYM